MISASIKIKKITRIGVVPTVCDVTVEDNHNLFVSHRLGLDNVMPHEISVCRQHVGSPYEKGFVLAHNCVLPFAIHEVQLARAEASGYHKFKKMVYGQSSNLSHALSVMEQKGVDIDVPYLETQLQPNSDMYKILDDAKQQMNSSDGAMEANKLLAEERGVSLGGGLFEDEEVEAVQMFNIDKPEHRQILFNDVMHLEPVSGYGKKARRNGIDTMTLDKTWQTEHREVHEVSLYTRINKISKLISSYIKSFHIKVTESDDGKKSGKLHPSYGFLYVKTGRGNSFKPSLQQTPSRGKEAKYVKRMFAVGYGRLKLKTDFSAQEVRFAGNISGDNVMAEPFNVARSTKTDMFRSDSARSALKARIIAELRKRGEHVD